MPDPSTPYISIAARTIALETDAESTRRIDALEASNFELRNQITRLQLHNATLRRMLKLPVRRLPPPEASRH